MAPLIRLFLICFVTGCASTHDLREGPNFWGGGYRLDEVKPGFYSIEAKTNVAQYPAYRTARNMWQSRADEVCGKGQFKEFPVREWDYEHLPRYMWARYIVTAKSAYALCNSSPLSVDEALAHIGRKPGTDPIELIKRD